MEDASWKINVYIAHQQVWGMCVYVADIRLDSQEVTKSSHFLLKVRAKQNATFDIELIINYIHTN